MTSQPSQSAKTSEAHKLVVTSQPQMPQSKVLQQPQTEGQITARNQSQQKARLLNTSPSQGGPLEAERVIPGQPQPQIVPQQKGSGTSEDLWMQQQHACAEFLLKDQQHQQMQQQLQRQKQQQPQQLGATGQDQAKVHPQQQKQQQNFHSQHIFPVQQLAQPQLSKQQPDKQQQQQKEVSLGSGRVPMATALAERYRFTFWTGQIKWIERSNGVKLNRSIKANVSSLGNQGNPFVLTHELGMDWVSKSILEKNGLNYKQGSKSVYFRPEMSSSFNSLSSSLAPDTGNLGILFSERKEPGLERDFIIIVYHPESKTFLGYLHTKPNEFLFKFWEVIRQLKQGEGQKKDQLSSQQQQLQGSVQQISKQQHALPSQPVTSQKKLSQQQQQPQQSKQQLSAQLPAAQVNATKQQQLAESQSSSKELPELYPHQGPSTSSQIRPETSSEALKGDKDGTLSATFKLVAPDPNFIPYGICQVDNLTLVSSPKTNALACFVKNKFKSYLNPELFDSPRNIATLSGLDKDSNAKTVFVLDSIGIHVFQVSSENCDYIKTLLTGKGSKFQGLESFECCKDMQKDSSAKYLVSSSFDAKKGVTVHLFVVEPQSFKLTEITFSVESTRYGSDAGCGNIAVKSFFNTKSKDPHMPKVFMVSQLSSSILYSVDLMYAHSTILLLKRPNTETFFFRKPAGICIINQGHIIISDNENRTLEKFHWSGTLLSTFKVQCNPTTLHYGSNGDLYVADELQRQVQCYGQFGLPQAQVQGQQREMQQPRQQVMSVFQGTQKIAKNAALSILDPTLAKGKGKGSGLTRPMKLSPDLAKICGQEVASRAETVKLVWAYLKKNKLQDPENKPFFTPDANMAKVFGTERMLAFTMTKFLTPHLTKI